MSRIVGIDLGTTNSAIAAVTDGDADVLVNAEGDRTTPSVVHFESSDSFVVGEPARRKMISDPESTVARVKRHMGKDDWTTSEIHGDTYTPQDISSLTLQKLVADAEASLNEDIDSAVITVPAYFGERERESTKAAGKLAGLNVKRIINEPTAACLAYGLEQEDVDDELALVYDLGGGTFDASLVDIGHGIIEVITTKGDQRLGGEDFDETLYAQLRKEFMAQENPDPEDDLQLKSALLEEARNAKETLSSQQSYEIDQPFLGPEGFSITITREMFNEVTENLVEETVDIIDELFAEVEHSSEDVDEVLLVGGSTRIPLVGERVEEYFGTEPSKEINPDEAVSIGASVQAAIIEAGEEGGAAGKQAEKLLPSGSEDLLLVDVCPKSLGLKLHDGSFDPIIERNEQIPARTEKSGYTTARDNQTSVRVEIFEGEEEVAEENTFLGEFVLGGIAPRPAGQPSIEVDFEIDKSGILHAEARDLNNGGVEDITIEDAFSMSAEEIDERRESLPSYKGEE